MFNKRFQDNMESKTYVFGNEGSTSNNGMLGLLAPLLQKQGVDPNVLLAIGKCESDGSIINTIGHELLHVVAHICEQDGIDMLSEEPCYIMGSLCEKFFKVYC